MEICGRGYRLIGRGDNPVVLCQKNGSHTQHMAKTPLELDPSPFGDEYIYWEDKDENCVAITVRP